MRIMKAIVPQRLSISADVVESIMRMQSKEIFKCTLILILQPLAFSKTKCSQTRLSFCSLAAEADPAAAPAVRLAALVSMATMGKHCKVIC
jgi:hypothetical protein